MDIPKTRTKGQLLLQSILMKLGFNTVLEYQVGEYFLDVYVPELKMGFEYDGPFHGLTKKHDKQRDEWLLKSQGIAVVRVTDEELKGDIEKYLVDKIEYYGDLRD